MKDRTIRKIFGSQPIKRAGSRSVRRIFGAGTESLPGLAPFSEQAMATESSLRTWINAAWNAWETQKGLAKEDYPEFVQEIEWMIWEEIRRLQAAGLEITESGVLDFMTDATRNNSPVSPSGLKWAEPTSSETASGALKAVLSSFSPYHVEEQISYGSLEFITDEDFTERAQRLDRWKEETDFMPLAEEIIITEKGTWRNLRSAIYRMATEFIKPFDKELDKRALARKPADYPLALEPEPAGEGPPGASGEWKLKTNIKRSLSRDPFMQEVHEFSPAGTGPFYQAVDDSAPGLVTIADPERTEGGVGAHHAGCGGYYAGLDNDGYPLFVTAAHCSASDGSMVYLPDGRGVLADVIAMEKDGVVLRGRERVHPTKELNLGTNEGGWALGLSPLYAEGELVRYDKDIEFETGVYVTQGDPQDRVGYGNVNLGRAGWSGSPAVNARGEVVGIASLGRSRHNAEYDEGGPSYVLGYVSLYDLQKLYQKAGMR